VREREREREKEREREREMRRNERGSGYERGKRMKAREGGEFSLRFLPKAVIPAGLNPGFIAALLITAARDPPPPKPGEAIPTSERAALPRARKPRATSGAAAIKKKS